MSWLLATTPEEHPYTDSAKTDAERLKNLFRAHGWVDPEPGRRQAFEDYVFDLADTHRGGCDDLGKFYFSSEEDFLDFVYALMKRGK